MANPEFDEIKSFAKTFFEFGKLLGEVLSPILEKIEILKGDRPKPVSKKADRKKKR